MGMMNIRSLHRRYDEPVPAEAIAAARAGGRARLDALRAESRRRVFDSLALAAVRALAGRRRGAGTGILENDPGFFALARNLRFYRDQGTKNGRN